MRSDFSGPSRRKEGAAYQIYHVENQNAVTSSRAKFFLRGLIHSETARIWGDLVRPGGQVSAKKFNRGLVAPKIESREESRRTVELLGRESFLCVLIFAGRTPATRHGQLPSSTSDERAVTISPDSTHAHFAGGLVNHKLVATSRLGERNS